MIIAIDGPVGSGKSTIAKLVAEKLGFTYIDTGAMYRAVALKILKAKIPLKVSEIVKMMENTKIDLVQTEEGLKVFLDGEDVSEEIRTEEVAKLASQIARYGEIRKRLVQLQRELGERAKNVVIEGRDTATVIFPNAELKIFLTATPEERARRRYKQLKEKGFNIPFEHLLEKVKERDKMDTERKESPLKPAEDSIIIDTTNKTIDEVVDEIINLAKERISK